MVPWYGKYLRPMSNMPATTANLKDRELLPLIMHSMTELIISHLKNTSKYTVNKIKFMVQYYIQYLNEGK